MKNTWQEEFDRLIDDAFCNAENTLLRTEHCWCGNTDVDSNDEDLYMHEHCVNGVCLHNYPESPYELDPAKVKVFIAKVEQEAIEQAKVKSWANKVIGHFTQLLENKNITNNQ